jgi:hypothetical protein
MAGYDGSGTLFALGTRITKLGDNGAPLVGAQNSYVTDALVKVELGLEYSEGEEISQKNGAGIVCVAYKAPDSLTRGTISGLQFCTPDPNVLSFIMGGLVLADAGDPTTQIGYAAPEVGSNPVPNGVAFEFWTRAIQGGAYASSLPYFHWLIPRAFVRPSGTWALSGEDPTLPEFEGTCTQNANWGDGPVGDWDYTGDFGSRVWQYVREAAVPALDPAFVAVVADA